MTKEQLAPLQYWIFKESNRNNLFWDVSTPGDLRLWILEPYADVKASDVVYFWREEDSSYFYAWGVIDSEPAPVEAGFGVYVRCHLFPSSPVMRGELREDPTLQPLFDLREIRKNIIEIDSAQAAALNKLIRKHGAETPPDPLLLPAEDLGEEEETELAADDIEDQPTDTTLDQLLDSYGPRLSPLTQNILKLAGQYANQRKRNRDRITTSCLLFAAIESGADSIDAEVENASQFLSHWMRRVEVHGSYQRAFQEFLIPTNPERRQGLAILTLKTVNLMETGARIANFVRKESVPSKRAVICARDLVGALLFTMATNSSLGAAKRLAKMDLNPETLRADYCNDFLSHNPNDDLEKWRQVLLELRPPPEIPQTHAPRETKASLPDIDADAPSGNADLLNIKHEVEGFARIIAAREVRTPLSIGLFGDWGSGKSTFMQRLQAEVEKIAAAVRSRKDGEETSFLGNIVQIEFNAWHYAEGNLWASLVSHVFENLSVTKEGDREMAAQKQTLFLNQLGVRLATQGAAEADVVAKGIQYTNAKAEVDAAKQAQSNARIELRELLKNGIWLIVREFAGSDAKKAQIDAAIALCKKTGMTEEELQREIKASRTTLGRIQWYLYEIWQNPRRWLYVFLILLAMIVIPILLTYVATLLGSTEVWVRLAKFATPFVPLLTGAFAWLFSKRKTVNEVLEKLETANTELDRIYEKARVEYDKRLFKFNNELLSSESAVNAANNTLEKAKIDVADTITELSNMTPERLLQNFVQERASSDDYRKLLGVIALIRRDFNKLSDMMLNQDDQRLVLAVASMLSEHAKQKVQNPPQNGDAAPAPADETETLAVKGAKQFLGEKTAAGLRELQSSDSEEIKAFLQQVGKFRIDRIVLYIDDLDRCPPRQVVHVLQAIHLLLAFKLFVVVVGVDARWVRQALRKYYPEMLDEDLDERGSDKGGERRLIKAATPRDYVEKIFQIPFWVRPMSADGSERFLRGLITDDQLVPAVNNNGREVAGELSHPGKRDQSGSTINTQVKGSDLSANDTEPADDEKIASETAASLEGTRISPSGSRAASPGVGTGAEAAGDKPDERSAPTIILKPDSLLLDPRERETMVALSQIIGKTPRTVKRFVNIYRIIKAGLDDKQLEAFSGTPLSDPQYPAVLVLLGVAHGSPDVAPVFFRGLKTRHERTIANGESATGLVGFLRLMAEAPGLAEPLHENWKCLIEDLGKFTRVSRTNIMVPVLCEWLPVVVRYTFQLGRLSDEIGQHPARANGKIA